MFRRTKVCTGLMLAFGGALSLGLTPALAQQTLEKVEITGSSIKRIEAETALPVQVINREAIEKTGAVTVEQLMQTISAAASSQAINSSASAGALTGGISSISLRGLSSQRTLVLINGRRIAPYGIGFSNDSVSVDVNSIPLAMVERVEILKDGASAVYGSDAIAGVVNFIMRKDFTGGEVTGYYGDTTDGGASVTRASALYGFGDMGKDRFNVMGMVSYQQEKPLYGGQRQFAASGVNNVNDATSGNTFPANIAAADGSFGTRNPSNPACPPPYATYDPQLTTKGCRFDPSPLVSLVPKTERFSAMLNGRWAITPEVEAYFEGSYNKNKATTILQPVPISDQFALPPNNPLFNVPPYNGASTILITPASPYYPLAYIQGQTGGATPDILVRWRDNVNGNRNFTDIASAPRLVAGARGSASGFDWDANYLHTESRVTEHVNSGYPTLSAILPILNSGNVNFWGPNTAAVDAQIRATDFGGKDAFKIKSSLDSLSAKASKEVYNLPAGPLAVAFGGEARKEKYSFEASPEIASGDISGYGGNNPSINKDRNVEALFGEINIPAFKGFEINAAVRWDHYQGVGGSTNPKLGLRYQPTKEILLRGSAGKGFRAPSLLDLYAPQSSGVSNAGLSDPARCPTYPGSVTDCNTQFPTILGGNPNLKPESSRNYTMGLVFEPTNNISVAVDYFWIFLKDTIQNGVPSATILSDPQFANLITRGPASPQDIANGVPGPIIQLDTRNLNLGKQNLAGYDWDARIRIPAGDWGRFTIAYSGTYFSRFDQENIDGSFTGTVGTANNSTGGVTPRLKTYLSATWNTGPWGVTVAQNWQASYADLPGNLNGDPRTVGCYETYDGQVQYTGVKNLRMVFGIRNVFNRAPPYSNAGAQVQFQAGYDASYGDPRGRFVYGSLTYAFK
jgi:iron complex outermembrane receptor protein